MRILVEEYQYDAAIVRDVLYGVDALQNVEGLVSLSYVGYFYNTKIKDCVFILPKVLMDEKNKVFGKYDPEQIIHVDQCKLEEQERKFIYEFAVWIYRAVEVFQRTHKDSDIVYHRQISQVGRGMRKRTNTLLDILLSLIQFNKDNQSYITFILKNIHSGFNKINWTRTISHSSAFVERQVPLYLDPVNKQRKINFDEELLIIFYSILNYIHEEYGFSVHINVGFPLITGAKFESYLKGRGVIRLRQIKYKYFSDKALELWQLCYAFFAHRTEITTSAELKEYLLVKNFYVVFEAIIDELIGDSKDELPEDFKEQKDGKLIDHLYTYPGLIEADEEQMTYYIGDSKYYKMGSELGKTSIYKQYTYARNIVQYNIELWLNGEKPDVRLRDDITEGYNVIPNFFISAAMEQGDYSYSHNEIVPMGEPKISYQFGDRLFDRDTLLLSRYNVNFLYVISLYARNRQAEKAAWKEEVRKQFRDQIRRVLESKFHFYPMRSRGVDLNEYMTTHFRELIGKVFTPFEDRTILSLALQNTTDPVLQATQEGLLAMLEKDFYIERNYKLGETPELPQPVDMQFGVQDTIIIGYYRDENQLKWIRDKQRYNLRIGKTRGSIDISAELVGAKYLFLYGPQGQYKYRLASENPVIWNKDDMIKQGYINPHHEFYFIFQIEEALVNGDIAKMQIDVKKVENLLREKGKMHLGFDKDSIAITMSEFVNCIASDTDSPLMGHCIRCGKQIPRSTSKLYSFFYCETDYRNWARYGNNRYKETYCHICGKKISGNDFIDAAHPLCHDCWLKEGSTIK